MIPALFAGTTAERGAARHLAWLLFGVSALQVIAVMAGWIATAQGDFALPLGNRWHLAGAAAGWRFNGDRGGWSLYAGPAGRAFYPDGFNARFSIQRHGDPASGWPANFAEQTLLSISARDLFVASVAFSAAIWAMFIHRVNSRGRGFPVSHD